MSAAGERAVITERFGESHADSRADARRQTNAKRGFMRARGIYVIRRKRSGEQRRERRNAAVHQPREARLHDLQHEQSSLGLLFFLNRAALLLLALEMLREMLVFRLFIGELIEQLANAGIGCLR